MRSAASRVTSTGIIAWLALFLSLGGVVYATTQMPKNSVSSSALKRCAVTSEKLANNAVTGPKVKSGSLDGSDIDLKSLGTVPSASSCGFALAAKTATEIAKVTYVTDTATVAAASGDEANTMATATAHCGPGQSVLGGGTHVESDTDQIVNDSHPVGTTAWTGVVLNEDANAHSLTVYAICAPVGDTAVTATD
jgi:hypothetical protein